jgi:hypothetical protein
MDPAKATVILSPAIAGVAPAANRQVLAASRKRRVVGIFKAPERFF